MLQHQPKALQYLKRRLVIGPHAITAAALSVVFYLLLLGIGVLPIACSSARLQEDSTEQRGAYSTRFPLTENPISEAGNWTNGQVTGLDWANVQTIRGLAFGTQTGAGDYNDSTALLTGTWGPDQSAEAKVYSVNQDDNMFEEVELRLRSSLSSHRATGYEINFRCSKTQNAYAAIVRWNGQLGNFMSLSTMTGPAYGVTTGDVVKATIQGNVITAYINRIPVLQATDSTYRTGNPGIGFYLHGTEGANGDFGFSSFAATTLPQAVTINPEGILSISDSRNRSSP